MRVTFVVPFMNLTGGIRVVLAYANWLHDEGHQVTVVYPLWPYRFHFTRKDQLKTFLTQLRRAPGVEWLDLRCCLRRVPFVTNTFVPHGDLVIATGWPVVRSVARLDASRGKKVHLLFHHESGTGPEDRIAGTYALPFYRIAFSKFIKGLMELRFKCEIHEVVRAGVDAATFFPDGHRTENTVLMLYHNDPRKGAADGVEALALLRRRVPEVEIRMCGTIVPDRLPPWIRFKFHPSDAELRRLYSTSTAFLYPSRYEGFGLPPLEAMSCGCPVVTTQVGAVSEFALDGQSALVVEPGDVRGMAERLEELLANARLRRELSQRGLQTAKRYALGRVAPELGAVLTRFWRQPPADLSMTA